MNTANTINTFGNDQQEIIELMRRKYHKLKFENELKYLKQLESTSDDDDWIEDRIQNLEEIIKNINDMKPVNKKKSMFDDWNKYIYKKPWDKLYVDHKMSKMKEFIDNNYKNDKFYNKLLNDVENLIYKNKLKKRHVIYDYTKEEIESIPALKINDDKENFEINIK